VLVDAGHEATPIPGETGQFDILADGELVFSKDESDRFPEEHEIVRALAGRA
jgi:selT/selW/selH-like putative selenoprotein